MSEMLLTADAAAQAIPAGIAEGTEVLTLTGSRPIENLRAGDRIITRSGACTLKGLHRMPQGFSMDFDRQEVVLLADGQVFSDTGIPYAA